jgi:hypothetical protein
VSVTIELDAQGALFVAGSRATLHEVEAAVLRATEARASYLRGKGQAGLERLPSGIQASKVEMLLRVHRDAPWRHVQWLQTLLGELRAPKIGFVAVDGTGAEGVVRAPLPLDAADEGGIELGDEEETTKPPPARAGFLTLTLIAEGEREAVFAGKPVRAPGSLAYAVGKRKVGDRAKFETILAEELRSGKVRTIEVRAEGRIPAGEVIRTVAEASAARPERLDAYRPVPLPRDLRGVPALPYPEPIR